MKKASPRSSTITTAQRALLIQHVLVDDWTSDKAAATFGVPAHLVEVWVADYRRHGMASLRRASGKTKAAEMVQLTVSRPVRAAFRKITHELRRLFGIGPLVPPLAHRRSNDEGRGSGS